MRKLALWSLFATLALVAVGCTPPGPALEEPAPTETSGTPGAKPPEGDSGGAGAQTRGDFDPNK